MFVLLAGLPGAGMIWEPPRWNRFPKIEFIEQSPDGITSLPQHSV
jgi:hypothetical protein